MENKIVNVAELPFVGADSAPTIYSNNADMAITPWDLRIGFSEIGQHGGEFRKRMLASVVMSPAHAKALITALTLGVQQWEGTYGEIRMPAAQASPEAKA